MSEEQLILVDQDDRPVGCGPKMEVHRQGLRHRAFSLFIWDGAGQLLLQRRAAEKYHSGGLWTNSCCGHPRVGEPVAMAASRRLHEELGMRASLTFHGTYSYRAELPNALIENELVHLYHGQATSAPTPNPAEVEDYRWVAPATLLEDFARYPSKFTAWFGLYLTDIAERVLSPPLIGTFDGTSPDLAVGATG